MSRPSTAALLFIRRSVINAATRSRTATALLSPLLQQQKQLSGTSCLTTRTTTPTIPATRFFSSSSSSSMGVTKEVIEEGYGPTPTKGQTVTVHCTGYGKNNDLAQKFWSTKDPEQDVFQFQVGVGQVIKGWDEGVLGMQKGERSKLTCTPEYAYGASGFSAWGILPNATLVFEIELLDFH